MRSALPCCAKADTSRRFSISERGVNPLWTPPWKSIEPSAYKGEYGDGVESRLLGGIMGHNLCLDVFGGPSDEEFAAGIGVHGEASVEPYEIEGDVMRTRLPLAGLEFERRIELRGRSVWIAESRSRISRRRTVQSPGPST